MEQLATKEEEEMRAGSIARGFYLQPLPNSTTPTHEQKFFATLREIEVRDRSENPFTEGAGL